MLTGAGLATPTVLLTLLFLIGCGQALTAPAWQAIQPDLVPREQIPAAAALGSMSMNRRSGHRPRRSPGHWCPCPVRRWCSRSTRCRSPGSWSVLLLWRRPATRAPAADRATVGRAQCAAAGSSGARRSSGGFCCGRCCSSPPAARCGACSPVVAERQLGLSSSGYWLLPGCTRGGGRARCPRIGRGCSRPLGSTAC